MDTGLSFFGRKGLPQGKALSLLTSPHNDAQLQVLTVAQAGLKGQKIGLGKGTGALEELRKGLGYQIVTHQPQAESKLALLGWACFQEPSMTILGS